MSHRDLFAVLLRDTAIGALLIVVAYFLGATAVHLLGGIA